MRGKLLRPIAAGSAGCGPAVGVASAAAVPPAPARFSVSIAASQTSGASAETPALSPLGHSASVVVSQWKVGRDSASHR